MNPIMAGSLVNNPIGKVQRYPRPAYKPHSVRREGIPEGTVPAWVVISLGSLPEAGTERAVPCIPGECLPLLGLAPDGGCLAAGIAADAGRLLPCLFTLTRSRRGRAVCFCGPIR